MVLWFSKWIAIGITRCKCEAGGHKLIDMVSHDNLKRLTVVIPSYGRREFLKRQISYWNGSLVQVLILDGSDVSAYDLQFPQNFRYVHSREGFLQRLLSATEMVDTEFVALLPDDEFFLESGLVDAIDYMDSNDQAIGCVGRCLYFFVDQGRFLLSHAYRDWRPFPPAPISMADRLDLDLPPNKTHMAMYGIYRRNHWITMIRGAYSVPFSCGYVYERLLNFQRSVLGRTEIIDSLLWMRSKENPPVTNSEFPRVKGRDFVSWATSAEFAVEVSRYREVARNILVRAGVNIKDIDLYVNRFVDGGVARQQSKEERARKSLRRKIGKKLLKLAPKRFRLLCKRHVPAQFLKFVGWEGHELPNVVCDLRSLGTRFDEAELRRIAELSLTTYGQIEVVRGI